MGALRDTGAGAGGSATVAATVIIAPRASDSCRGHLTPIRVAGTCYGNSRSHRNDHAKRPLRFHAKRPLFAFMPSDHSSLSWQTIR